MQDVRVGGRLAGHAAKAGTNPPGAGGLYPSDACGLIVLQWCRRFSMMI
jgi:hypothetical protein